MKISLRLLIILSLSLIALLTKAAESSSWDLANNSVTYSDSITMALGETTQTINLSQFNSSIVAAQEGIGTAAEYTLSKVVLSIDGSIAGIVEFENETSTAANNVRIVLGSTTHPNYQPYGGPGWSRISVNGESAIENYTYSESFGAIAADSDDAPDWTGDDYGSVNVSSSGSGEALSGDITSGLEYYIGSDTIAADVDFQGTWTIENLPNNTNRSEVYGDAVVSVTYYYDYTPVPEPSSLACLCAGLVLLFLRRKPNKKSNNYT